MARADAGAAVPVERFFQFSMLGLAASGYLAVAGSGYLDTPTIVFSAAALLLRALMVCGLAPFEISDRASTIATVAYATFFLVDYFFLSRELLQASVHLAFFQAMLRIVAAKTGRDHVYVAAIAFLELLAAAILSINLNFFIFLAFFLLFAMGALTSGEIRRSLKKTGPAARAVPRFYCRLAALSTSITLGILALTAGLFFVAPRTADAALSRLISHRIHIPGFNQVTLGETGEIKTTSRPVMHIRVYSRELPHGLKWRGASLAEFDGRRWSNPIPVRERIPVQNGQADLEPSASLPPWLTGLSYQVDYDGLATDTLFFAGIPGKIYLHESPLMRAEGESYRLGRPAPQGFRYEAYSLIDERPEQAPPRYPPPVLPLAVREKYIQLPGSTDRRIAALARDLTRSASTDLQRARAIERYLRTELAYSLQLPSREVPDPLAHFLFNSRKGHCEYFASAMAVLLRTIGVPSRLATGFQTGEYNPYSELWLVRASDAHSWVEAWIPGHGWATFDPTPADPNAGFAFVNRLGLYLDAAQTFWRQWVLGYDSGHQGSLADFARNLGLRWTDTLSGMKSGWDLHGSGWLKQWGAVLVTLLALAVWMRLLGPLMIRALRFRLRVQRARRGQASVGDATVLYQRMLHILKRHGYQKPAWFTPSEFARSLARTPLGDAVEEFTGAYNALRFGGRVEVAPRLSLLLDRLERQERIG